LPGLVEDPLHKYQHRILICNYPQSVVKRAIMDPNQQNLESILAALGK